MPRTDRAKPIEQTIAERVEIGKSLTLPNHDNYMGQQVSKCSGSGKTPESGEVYANIHREIAPVTALCLAGCSSIFALVPSGKSFRWECMGVYGYAPDGTPQGP